MGILAGKTSTQMAGFGSSFHSKESNSMVAEAMGKYVLASTGTAYEDTGEQATMGFMAARVVCHEGNSSHWWDKKEPHFPARFAHRTLTGRPPLCTWVWLKRP